MTKNESIVKEVIEKIRPLVKRFVALDSLKAISKYLIRKESPGIKKDKIEELSKKVISDVIMDMEKKASWKARRMCIFDGVYPLKTHEFLSDRAFALFGATEAAYNTKHSYTVKKVTTFSNPSVQQLLVMAPKLAQMVVTDKGTKAFKSVDTDRFKLLQDEALNESALVNMDVRNRPCVMEKSRWELHDNGWVKKILVPTLIKKKSVGTVIKEFITDLTEALAWKSEDAMATYLACFIQPMLVHLKPGMFPGYMFSGPTKSGKGFLSKKLLDWFYKSNLPRAVSQNKFPKDTYEMGVSLNEAKDCLYYACDEVRDLKEDQAKILDNLLTSSELSLRVMREGIVKIPNHLTVTMAAVVTALSDETWGRIAMIELTESRTKTIESFLKKWELKAPELMHAIFTALEGNSERLKNHSIVDDRRPGFGLVADATEIVFGLRPSFKKHDVVNDILEVICSLEKDSEFGDMKGKRKRLSKANIRRVLNDQTGVNLSISEFQLKLGTALGTGNKRTYVAENGKRYFIELSVEGDEKRTFIYVQRLKAKQISTFFEENEQLH